MLVLVCGDRNWIDYERVYNRLKQLPLNTTVIEGGCKGADLLGREAALKLGFDVIEFPANWVRHGKVAGPVRNAQMLDLSPELVIAFHPNLKVSKGTADCVRQARKRQIPIEVIE